MASGESLIMNTSRGQLIKELKDKAYRDAFVEAHVGDSIASQLKAMRLAKKMDQSDVAALLGNERLQPMVSRYENPDYGKYSVSTLLELAKAFDVALVVHFAPFSELVDWDLNPREAKLDPAPFTEDEALWGEGQSATTVMVPEETFASTTGVAFARNEVRQMKFERVSKTPHLSARAATATAQLVA